MSVAEQYGVGFSGTRKGMIAPQSDTFKKVVGLFWAYFGYVLHQGCCNGADRQAFEYAKASGVQVIHHPPTNMSNAWDPGSIVQMFDPIGAVYESVDCEWDDPTGADIIRPPFPYMLRNEHIIDETRALIATPRGMQEDTRGGTWHAIKYARLCWKPVAIVFPGGSIRLETWNETLGRYDVMNISGHDVENVDHWWEYIRQRLDR